MELPIPTVVSALITNVLYLALTALVLWYVYDRYINRRYYDLGNSLPGPDVLPIFGNGLLLFLELGFTTSQKIFQKFYSRSFEFGDVGRVWVGNTLVVFLVNPKDVELVLGSNVHIDKGYFYSFFKPWLGNGLLISTGKKWKDHRKLIAPTFHLNVLKTFFDVFNSNSRDIVAKLRQQGGKEFDCHDYLSECTVDILVESVMGVKKTTQYSSAFDYAMAVMKMCNILQMRQAKFWLWPTFLFNQTYYARDQVGFLDTIHSLTGKVIKTKKEILMKNNKTTLEKPTLEKILEQNEEKLRKLKSSKENFEDKFSFGQATGLKDDLDIEDNDVGERKRSAFLDFMMECADKGVGLTNDEVRDQVNTIMFEGHDTTAAASSFFLCIMGAHPDIQDKCLKEVDDIFGDSDRPCTFQDTLEMKYIERCIMETIRMYPPVPVIAREIKQDITLASSSQVIPAHSTVVIGTFKIHRNPEVFPSPDTFNPDNFLPEKCASRDYYAFIPFSAGPRSCVGRKYALLKLKVLLSTILRNFRVVGGEKEREWKLQGDIILKRADGFNIKLEPRKRGVIAGEIKH